jgi:hypothetical protein
MAHAIGLAADAAPAIDAALLIARAEGDPAMAYCIRFGFEPFLGETGWLYLRLRDVEATLSSGSSTARDQPPRLGQGLCGLTGRLELRIPPCG